MSTVSEDEVVEWVTTIGSLCAGVSSFLAGALIGFFLGGAGGLGLFLMIQGLKVELD